MTRRLSRVVRWCLIAAVAAGVVLVWRSDGYRDVLAIRLVVIAAGAIAGFALLDRVRTAHRPGGEGSFERIAAGHPPEPSAVLRYEQLRRLVELAGSASTVHVHLRPVVTDIATERFLADRRLTVDDPAAAGLVPPRTWALIRPDRPRPRDADATGLSRGELDGILGELTGEAPK